MQTTNEERIKAEIKILKSMLNDLDLKDIVDRQVYLSLGGSYRAVLFVSDTKYYVYDLGHDINDTIKALEAIKQGWS